MGTLWRGLMPAIVALPVLPVLSAAVGFKGYFDVSGVALAALGRPHWEPRTDGRRVRFLCVEVQTCPTPTVVEINGVLRTETLPVAFLRGPMSRQMYWALMGFVAKGMLSISRMMESQKSM